jgi:pilus assembly protein CpaE
MAGEQIRLLVVEDVPQVASHMRALLQAQSQIKILDVITAGDRAASAVTEYKPDVVIVDALLQGRTSGQQVAQTIRANEPQVGIVMVTVPQNPVREDPERGVDAILKMPFSGFDLLTIVRKTYEERTVEASRAGSMMVTLFSPKGGVGRTTIAYNLAVSLGSAGHRVCLVDGALQFSDLRGLLRVPAAAPSLVNLPTDRIRESDVADVAWKDPSGIDVVLAPPRVEMAEMVTVRDIEKALSILRQLYEFVVIDTRAALSDDVLVFLDASDLILQVLTYDSMAIRGLAMANEAFDAIGYPATKLATVVNRADSAGGFQKADVEAAIGRPIDYEIVSDGHLVVAANNEGVPFVSGSPDAPISQGVRRIADSLSSYLSQRAPALARS